jgi:hypothetical protein
VGVTQPRADLPAWRWRWHLWANAPVLAWLAVSAGLAAASAMGSRAVPSWLGVHTLLLGGRDHGDRGVERALRHRRVARAGR